MPAHMIDPADSIVPLSPQTTGQSVVYPVRHGLKPPVARLSISWCRGNLLTVTYFRQTSQESTVDDDVGGKVVEVQLNAGDHDVTDAQTRRVAYSSLPAFAMLQNRRHSMLALSKMSSYQEDWWQHVLEYSKLISALLGIPEQPHSSVLEDPKSLIKVAMKPNPLKAAWELIEFFYVDKQLRTWLNERLVDWLADYDCLLSKSEATVHSKLVDLQKKLFDLEIIENDAAYWDGISSALAVGWHDIVVKLLRLHGSYQLDQLGNRETENGLVEAVAVLVSTMPRMRPELRAGNLGQCFRSKPDFMKAWEKWRAQIAKLECSAFWVQCGHHLTKEGLRSLLQIMLGNTSNLMSATCHWMELFISHLLYIRPFTTGLGGMHELAKKCMQLKQIPSSHGLMGLLLGSLNDNTEVVLAECSIAFGPWMVVHAVELLTAENTKAEDVLHEGRYDLGGISIEELHRLVYAQVLSSHALTWQIAPAYLLSCPKHGLGLLEILLCKQPIWHNQMILKSLEICRLYDLDDISSSIMKIAGIHHWKHGRKGSGVYWLQQARDGHRLSRIAQQLFYFIGKSISDDGFKQWEGLIELLGSEAGTAGGLDFLYKYRDFKKSLQQVRDEKATNAARQATESLILLMKNPSTPERFWLPLLHDSLKLLYWPDQPLLNVSETNLLLSKLQELSFARLRPDFCESKLPPHALSSVRLALARNLGRTILEDKS
ncbi:nuclear pore complex protein NUP85 [Aristolochia californica]|uniref:nuclear pore complex protein NUP85 n=1 Tax=Aristolochia californica TaxID=171875 RepID=UPI0035E191BB